MNVFVCVGVCVCGYIYIYILYSEVYLLSILPLMAEKYRVLETLDCYSQ